MAKRQKFAGVFTHLHVKTGCFYVGTSADVQRGVVEDKRRLNKGEHFNHTLQRLFDEDSAIESSIEICESLPAAKVRRTEIVAGNFSNPKLLNRSGGLNTCAVYRLTHCPSGYFYIGSSRDFTNRRKHHEYLLSRGEHTIPQLQELFNQHPDLSTLRWDVILVNDRETGYLTEQKLLDEAKGDPLLLNLSSGVRGRGGYIMSDLEKEELQKVNKRNWDNPETRRRMVEGKWKKVSVDGVEYASAKGAAIALGIPYTTLCSRLDSSSITWSNWKRL